MMYFGTSGFSYNDWVGSFYPSGMPKREWLIYYAREFNTCEINSSFYALPKPSSLKAMAEKSFIFANNHWRGQAVNTIRQLRTMLD